MFEQLSNIQKPAYVTSVYSYSHASVTAFRVNEAINRVEFWQLVVFRPFFNPYRSWFQVPREAVSSYGTRSMQRILAWQGCDRV